MKQILKFTVYILLVSVIAFASCSKEKAVHTVVVPPRPPASPVDTLSGKEFVFSDLIWLVDADGSGLVYTSVENRPDLFLSPDRPMEVSIRLDTSAIWINVPGSNSSNGYEYFYSINLGYLFVFNYPSDYHLAGTNVSIKVKFL